MERTIKQGLAALECEDPRILILGSLPSDASIDANEYYANPKNFFWRVVSEITSVPRPFSYEAKRKMLACNHIALWDVYAFAERKGSLDSAIKGGEFNDIASMVKQYPSITKIVFNGKKSLEAFARYLRSCPDNSLFEHITFYSMPSTSSLVLSSGITYEELVEKWKTILN